jgi:MFS family permease
MTPASASVADVRQAYVNQAAISYSFYVVGAATAFIAVALSLSETQAGLHSSAMAVGLIVAGVAGERFDVWLGVRRVHLFAMGVLAISLVTLALAPVLWLTLAAALGIGLGAGAMFGHVNQTLGAGGGATARVQLTRAAFLAKSSQLMAPVAIAVGVAFGFEWQFVVLPVLVLVGVLMVWARATGSGAAVHIELGRLPRAYWLPWILTVSVIGLEFFVVVWGGTLVESRTGTSLSDATLTISAFIGGMIAGRALMSLRTMGQIEPMLVIRSGVALTFVAVVVLWLSGSYWLSAAAMALSGFGVGILYPPCASITLAAAPDAPAAASARLVLAAGLAILVAPLLLGVMADLSDIGSAWLLVPGVCVGVALLTLPVDRARSVRELS